MPGTVASLEENIRNIRLIAFDFDGVFTDNRVLVLEDGREGVFCSRADGLGLGKLRQLGIHTLIVSAETNPVVGFRSRKLGVNCIQGCQDKRSALENVVREMHLSLERVAFVGNDINDLPCLAAVGLAIAVADACSEVIAVARYRTQVPGGHGAVREICDLFERVCTSQNVSLSR